MDLGLSGRAVLVTGGSRGLGLALAEAFAGEGARVAICARNPRPLAAARDRLRATGADVTAIAADLSISTECERMVDDVVDAFGHLDVLVNNASVAVDAHDAPSAEDLLLSRVNGKALAAIRCSRAALPALRAGGQGRIVFIGGTSARSTFRGDEVGVGSPSLVPNAVGNSMVTSFAKVFADEVASDGVLVNVVHPHVLRTDRHGPRVAARAAALGLSEADAEADMAAQNPIGRMIEPGDVVGLVLFLASSRASAITGQAIAVDGGACRSIVY